jgi:preprotein translocase subunit Sss1
MAEDGIEKPGRFKYVNLAMEIADDVILGIVALGIVGLAVVLLIDAISEFAREAQHNYPYVGVN